MDEQQVPDHPRLHVALALAEQIDEVGDQVFALPVLDRAVATARLDVVVAALEHAAGQRSKWLILSRKWSFSSVAGPRLPAVRCD